jgi:hypothetical protein
MMKRYRLLLALIFISTTGFISSCESDDRKYYREAVNDFHTDVQFFKDKLNHFIPVIIEDEKKEEKQQEEHRLQLEKKSETYREFREQGRRISKKWKKDWEAIKKRKGIHLPIPKAPKKWKFWDEIANEPYKYVAKTKDDKVLVKVTTSKFEGESGYYSAMISMLFLKDNHWAFLRIFFIHTREDRWNLEDCELGLILPIPMQMK